MFEKLKNMFCGKLEYVVDMKTFEEYLRKELQFTLENNLEACVNLYIFYKGEKHTINIWNFATSSLKNEQEKELSVTFDEIEYNSIDNLLNNATIANNKLMDIEEYFVIELIDVDSEFLNQYKIMHPELNVEDYK